MKLSLYSIKIYLYLISFYFHPVVLFMQKENKKIKKVKKNIFFFCSMKLFSSMVFGSEIRPLTY